MYNLILCFIKFNVFLRYKLIISIVLIQDLQRAKERLSGLLLLTLCIIFSFEKVAQTVPILSSNLRGITVFSLQ